MELSFEFIGWCKEDSHDKVWGVIHLQRPENDWTDVPVVTFWGRRGKKLQTKMSTRWEAEKVVDKKRRNGYNPVDETQLDAVYPEFRKDLEKTAFWSQFKV